MSGGDWMTTTFWTSDPKFEATLEVACRNKAAMDKAMLALNAFDALLAVAHAAYDDISPRSKPNTKQQLADAVETLFKAHPGWREWPHA